MISSSRRAAETSRSVILSALLDRRDLAFFLTAAM
jgi:hypothetical protein